jgi:glutathione peroxidase
MKFITLLLSLLVLGSAVLFGGDMDSIYTFSVDDIDGNTGTLKPYEGNVMLIVNTASKCGFTYQYEGLQTLYETYKDQGLVILGFPTNDFMGQEPGTNEEIKEFCSLNFNVSFPMFSKITVKGKNMHPLYDYLTSKKTNPEFAGKISWNFNKFLIDREGNIVNRFSSKVKPGDPKVIEAIETALKS